MLLLKKLLVLLKPMRLEFMNAVLLKILIKTTDILLLKSIHRA